jgi:hypothetical protein
MQPRTSDRELTSGAPQVKLGVRRAGKHMCYYQFAADRGMEEDLMSEARNISMHSTARQPTKSLDLFSFVLHYYYIGLVLR